MVEQFSSSVAPSPFPFKIRLVGWKHVGIPSIYSIIYIYISNVPSIGSGLVAAVSLCMNVRENI